MNLSKQLVERLLSFMPHDVKNKICEGHWSETAIHSREGYACFENLERTRRILVHLNVPENTGEACFVVRRTGWDHKERCFKLGERESLRPGISNAEVAALVVEHLLPQSS